VAFAAQVLSQQQPMRAALSLVGHMASLAAIYACLGAHVVAVFQILIYVGAVMVFMVYTIMLLDERDRSYRQPFSRLGVPALLIAILVAAAFLSLLGDLPATAPNAAAATDLFSFTAFSLAFMKQYWFHFELATVLLLVGILAAWTALREGCDG
jgi:NADH-quinone oxidoreductase subunit J